MPEIDTDLFQLVVMALLVILLIVLLLVLNNLTRLAKSLAEAVSDSGPARSEAPARHDTPASSWDSGYTDVPQQQSYTPAAQTAYEPVPQQAQPSADYTRAPAQEEAPAQSAQPAARSEPIPEDQPFEREGRWWFKRGDELLVYDEQQGQWQPAPAGSLGQSASPGVATEYQSLSDSSPAPASSGSDAGWKCPSCGAVNGATAASCRMCFAERP